MATFKLNADIRAKDEIAKKIKQNKGLAGVVYGKTQEPISLKMDYSEFLRTFRKAGESQIITLTIGKLEVELEKLNKDIEEKTKENKNEEIMKLSMNIGQIHMKIEDHFTKLEELTIKHDKSWNEFEEKLNNLESQL